MDKASFTSVALDHMVEMLYCNWLKSPRLLSRIVMNCIVQQEMFHFKVNLSIKTISFAIQKYFKQWLFNTSIASQPENAKEIDRYVLSLAARGDYEKFHSMLLDGYDHVVDIVDGEETTIFQVAQSRGNTELAALLQNWREFEVFFQIN